MKFWKRRSWLPLVVIAALVIVLLVLAVLQYQWSGRVSEAEHARMAASLNTAVQQFRREFQLDLQRICNAFQLNPGAPSGVDRQSYVRRYDNWLSNTAVPNLIRHLYIWDTAAESPTHLWQLIVEKRQFESVSWPAQLEKVRTIRYLTSAPRPFMDFRLNAWIFLEEIPLLIYAMPSLGSEPGTPRSLQFLMIELNRQTLQQEVIPDLAQRYFGGDQGFIYQIAILNDRHPERILYQSEPTLSPDFFSGPDIRIHLFLEPRDFFQRPPGENPPEQDRPSPPGSPGGPGPPEKLGERTQPLPPPNGGGPRLERLRTSSMIVPYREGDRWLLLARHHEGTLGKVVANQRYRNLAISFGILLLLALSMAMIVLSTYRAQRLAKLQMEFVAGVSHELRTPISVIRAAGDNLADGVIAESDQKVRQYGELIRQEGIRLSGIVEQILQFVSTQAGYKKYHLLPAPVGEVIDFSLSELQPMITAAQCTVEKQIEANLPMAKVDKTVLSKCLENLISNAVKYSTANPWLRIRAAALPTRGGRQIQITVEDKGIGIEKADLPNIFEPFYRGRAAAEAQIHGNGLGLFIAKEGLAAMGGRISVKSKRGAGSVFTIFLPALSSTDETPRQQDEEKNTAG